MVYLFALLFFFYVDTQRVQSSVEIPIRQSYPQIISHRGASGYEPEHSLAGYQLAIDLGTDYIEPDLCVSKDGVLVVSHDITLNACTDITDHPEFADRERKDGSFLISDFTVEEIKTLRLKQRHGDRTTLYNGLFQMPVFSEVLDLAQSSYASTGYTVGVYAELKQPDYHNALGYSVSMEEMVINDLVAAGYSIAGVKNNLTDVNPIVLQCFNPSALIKLSNMTDLPLVQLIGEEPWSEASLDAIAQYAQGIGPSKDAFIGIPLDEARSMMQLASDRGLAVHPYTFQQESSSVSAEFDNDPTVELAYFYCCLGTDAVFGEFADREREIIEGLNNNRTEICEIGGC